MTQKFRLPRYFSQTIAREIQELYASAALADLALSIVMLFEPIFLYSVLGFSVQQVLWFFAGVYALYLLLIPIGARLVSIYGYEHGIFMSIPFQVIYWLLLFGSIKYPFLVILAPIALAMDKSLYWPAFHASVARFARDGQKGREFSMLHAIVNLAFVAGPFIGGYVGAWYGLQGSILVAAVIYVSSFIPLFTTKEVFTPKPYQYAWTWNLFKKYPKKFLGYLGFGEELLVLTVWPIFIFLIVKNYEETGILATIATVVATILALYVGKVTDRSSKTMLVKVGAFFSALVFFARFMVNNFMSVVVVDALSRTAKDVLFIPLSTVTYERAEATHIMPYVVFFEQSLSVGKLIACLLGIVIFTLTGSFMALFILAGLFCLLYMFL